MPGTPAPLPDLPQLSPEDLAHAHLNALFDLADRVDAVERSIAELKIEVDRIGNSVVKELDQ